MIITILGVLISVLVYPFSYCPTEIVRKFVSIGIIFLSIVIPALFTCSMIGKPPALENEFTVSNQYMIEGEDFSKITVKKMNCKEPTMKIYRHYSESSLSYSFCAGHKEAILCIPKDTEKFNNTKEE